MDLYELETLLDDEDMDIPLKFVTTASERTFLSMVAKRERRSVAWVIRNLIRTQMAEEDYLAAPAPKRRPRPRITRRAAA